MSKNLSNELKLRKGTYEQHESFVGAMGEVTVVTTVNPDSGNHFTDPSNPSKMFSLRVHDGATVGGYKIPTFTQVKQYVGSQRYGFSSLSDEVNKKLREIDEKLSRKTADSLYRAKNVKIGKLDLDEEITKVVFDAKNELKKYEDLLASPTGSSLIGFRADQNDISEAKTVEQALNLLSFIQNSQGSQLTITNNTLQDTITLLTSTREIADTNAETIVTINETLTNHASTLDTHTNGLVAANNAIILAESNANAYTDRKIDVVNGTTSSLQTQITNIVDTTYTKTNIDKSLTGLDDKIKNNVSNIAGLDSRLANAESVLADDVYRKAETDRNIKKAVADLVGSAPETLDTLQELADALGNQADFAASITAKLGTKVNTAEYIVTKNAVFNEKTGLVGRMAIAETDIDNLETGLASSNERIATNEQGIANLNAIVSNATTGLVDRTQVLEEQVRQLNENMTNVLTTLNSKLSVVAYSGKYKDLLEIPERYIRGQATFNSLDGVTISLPANYVETPEGYSVAIQPTASPTGTIGEVWVVKETNSFKVFCSGATTTLKFDYVIFRG